jgi:hypothetical protein
MWPFKAACVSSGSPRWLVVAPHTRQANGFGLLSDGVGSLSEKNRLLLNDVKPFSMPRIASRSGMMPAAIGAIHR